MVEKGYLDMQELAEMRTGRGSSRPCRSLQTTTRNGSPSSAIASASNSPASTITHMRRWIAVRKSTRGLIEGVQVLADEKNELALEGVPVRERRDGAAAHTQHLRARTPPRRKGRGLRFRRTEEPVVASLPARFRPSLATVPWPIRCIDDRTKPVEAFADLLWFPTGGGKTEAYLGVAAFAMAIRRMQGETGEYDGSRGLTVIMRYTLRLLTLQQFQRATTLICAMEVARTKALSAGDDSPRHAAVHDRPLGRQQGHARHDRRQPRGHPAYPRSRQVRCGRCVAGAVDELPVVRLGGFRQA